MDKYGYDRQAAFYADVLGAHRVVLIAVQKKQAKGQEPQVWVHELTAEQMQAGRKSTTSCSGATLGDNSSPSTPNNPTGPGRGPGSKQDTTPGTATSSGHAFPLLYHTPASSSRAARSTSAF